MTSLKSHIRHSPAADPMSKPLYSQSRFQRPFCLPPSQGSTPRAKLHVNSFSQVCRDSRRGYLRPH